MKTRDSTPNTSQLIDRPTAAHFLGVRAQTLATWSCNHRYDLPFVKIGRRVMYRIADLHAFVERNTIGTEVLQ
jgi:hypothetical protein